MLWMILKGCAYKKQVAGRIPKVDCLPGEMKRGLANLLVGARR